MNEYKKRKIRKAGTAAKKAANVAPAKKTAAGKTAPAKKVANNSSSKTGISKHAGKVQSPAKKAATPAKKVAKKKTSS